jgi:putative SOS response-associated peptidase YedK
LISAKHLDETEDSATRVLCSMRWSLVPHYHKGNLAEYKPILNNCRVETIEEKPTFKVPLRNGRRCIILAEGYVQHFNCYKIIIFIQIFRMEEECIENTLFYI